MKINNIYLLLILLINTIVFTAFIFVVPGFITDDFYIFTTIKENITHPVPTNSSYSFFLFLRPVTYFSFWLNIVAGFSPFYMKFFSLMIHLLLIVSLISLFKEISSVYKKFINIFWLAFFVFLFSLSDVSTDWIVWLSQRSELLMMLFLILSLKFYIRFTDDYKLTNYIVFLLFYLLSVFSKQTSVNLPLLLLLLHIWGYGKFKLKSVKYLFAPLFVMLFILILNVEIIDSESKALFYSNLWKKPFAIVGTLLITLFPFLGNKIYNYFMGNTSLASVLLMILVTLIIVLIFKYRSKSRNYIYLSFIILATFFPLIGQSADDRNRSLQILILTIILLLGFLKGYYGKLLLITYASIYIILNTLNAFYKLDNYNEKVKADYQVVSEYDEFIQIHNNNNSIIAANPIFDMIDYIYYYYKNNEFGKYNLNATPIIAQGNYDVEIQSENISVSSKPNSIVGFIDLDNNSGFKITDYEQGDKRSFKKITITAPDTISLKNKKIFYYKNGEWMLYKE